MPRRRSSHHEVEQPVRWPSGAAPSPSPSPSAWPSRPRAVAQKTTKDTLNVVGATHQATLDPHFAITTQDLIFTRNIYNALVKFKPNSIEFEPDLATSWTVSRDGLEYTFKLRRDVEWHKGYGKLTAADVKGSFDRLLDPATKSPFAGSMRMLKEAVVVDDATVKLVLKEPYAGFLYLLTPYRAGPIVNARAVTEKGAGYAWDPSGPGRTSSRAASPTARR